MRFSSLALIALIAPVACSSSTASSEPEKPTPLELADAPAKIDVYDGRTTTLPIAIRTADPSKLVVTVTSDSAASDGVATELLPSDNEPGVWKGSLRVHVGYTLVGGAGPMVSFEMVDSAGQRVTRSIALEVHKLGWQKRLTWEAANGPQTREHAAFLYDGEARAAYLLQGSGYNPYLKPIEDSWRLDVANGTWTSWTPTGDVPVAGGSRRIAQVPGTKKFYAYGGYIGFESTATDDGDLYRIDLGDAAHTFTRLTNVGAGSARELHAVAYDAKGEQLVVFGGFATKPTQVALDDTWFVKFSGDSATWTQLKTTKAPSPRYGSFSAFDAEARRFIVWSGGQLPENQADPVNAAQDAWALDLAVDPPKWSKLAPEGEAPKGRRNGCSMHDPIGRRLFVYGGTSDGKVTEKGLYVLDLRPGNETWTKLTLPSPPPLRSSGFGFATAEGDVTCAFGNDAKGYLDVAYLGY